MGSISKKIAREIKRSGRESKTVLEPPKPRWVRRNGNKIRPRSPRP